ncbi:MAG: creatininase family protein [Firmicutes bacterium]|nr:creatininase family protein [Bacillota bacterium]
MNISIFNETMVDWSWQELEARKGNTVLLPLGVIEEHGPHLPLGSDIYFSYGICQRIQQEVERLGGSCVIAPPMFWGINYCTGGFPGSFSLRPETMKMLLADIFADFKRFGFNRVICVNEHGDPLHIQTILESVQEANQKGMRVQLLMEPYELKDYGVTDLDCVLVDEAEYPPELFGEGEGLDIHAGAYETAALYGLYPEMIKETDGLPDYSLNRETIRTWMGGGESVKTVVPLGYAGNPAHWQGMKEKVKGIFEILCQFVAQKIVEGDNERA